MGYHFFTPGLWGRRGIVIACVRPSIRPSACLSLPKFYLVCVINPHRVKLESPINTLRPRQNGRHFPNDIFKWIFLNENVWISISFSLKFVPRGPINNIPTLVQVMAWRRPGDKPLSEPVMVRLPPHICVTRPQWDMHQTCIMGYYQLVLKIGVIDLDPQGHFDHFALCMHAITRHRFWLASPNSHQTCIVGYSQLILKMGSLTMPFNVTK